MTVRYSEIFTTEEDRRMLEAVRQQQGLENLDQAAEVALRGWIRKGTGRIALPRGPRAIGRR
ncbi:hypothetical protein [Kushneria phosphatilytica]|uniref:Uncharacterized protein n=1 Tax=Kushneria phosphatilytica TaxID=657387 RepID=A0A1S1NW00_9GAMM|nr:hypothetical protein [Kushneria phosphatilytica]OHV11177.1 hypothetical protein BH688_07575 [Kushneria phosphatilytica]QEL12254.1 hypothetical protein FY550_14655 [Kushneria phosphatilytica]